MQSSELRPLKHSRKMDTKTSPLEDHKIGQVFTPIEWAVWLIEKWGLFDQWLEGLTVCDPSAGEGVFALALFKIASEKGIKLTEEMISRIWLIDICSESLNRFKLKANQQFDLDFPQSNIINADLILDTPSLCVDVLVGNPPWCNFADLPRSYKDSVKDHFISEGLVPDKKKVLLGSSRTDIAALIVNKALGKLLKPSGKAVFYLPSSLFLGDDAHRGFRSYTANNRRFSIQRVFEFSESKVFPAVGTQYCCAEFSADSLQRFPVAYYRETTTGWAEQKAYPLKESDDQWQILDIDSDRERFTGLSIVIGNNQQPRQGVNSCGANDIFIFDTNENLLPKEFLFPLLSKEIWKGDKMPCRWILLPYDKNTARPLSWSQIKEYPALAEYLSDNKSLLLKRKGTMIRSSIEKGYWWAALGVGPYSFSPFKVAWQAYGKSEFKPIIVGSHSGLAWQGNQAMHAFIPCWSEADATRIHGALDTPLVTDFLKQLNGEGKCNWAQPGKVKKLLALNEVKTLQASLF
jgi:hypothetical protein